MSPTQLQRLRGSDLSSTWQTPATGPAYSSTEAQGGSPSGAEAAGALLSLQNTWVRPGKGTGRQRKERSVQQGAVCQEGTSYPRESNVMRGSELYLSNTQSPPLTEPLRR